MHTQEKDNVSILLSLKKLPVKIEMIDYIIHLKPFLFPCLEKKSLEKIPNIWKLAIDVLLLASNFEIEV